MSHYDTLGVSINCTSRQLRASYKQLALKWHPDKCNDPAANDKFKQITEAYNCLLNNRVEYDRRRHAEAKRGRYSSRFELSDDSSDDTDDYQQFSHVSSGPPMPSSSQYCDLDAPNPYHKQYEGRLFTMDDAFEVFSSFLNEVACGEQELMTSALDLRDVEAGIDTPQLAIA